MNNNTNLPKEESKSKGAHKKTAPAIRKNVQAEAVIEQLKKEATVLKACEKVGMSRSKFYRMCREESGFKARTDEALIEGISLACDKAENVLQDLIEKGDKGAIKMYLPTWRAAYARKVAGSGANDITETDLTDEEKSIIDRALRDILPQNNKTNNDHE